MKTTSIVRDHNFLWATRIIQLSILTIFVNASLYAQLKGTHLVGDMGLQSGSQPPPSITGFVALYNYHTSKFIKGDGAKIEAPGINLFLLGLGGSVVTNVKITPTAWVVDPMMKIIAEFEKSLTKYPLIKPGTPDPYQPPNNNSVK